MQQPRIETKALSDVLGGEVVSPLDLGGDVPDAVIRQLEEALYRHQVLVIPKQSFSPARFAAFARRLGRPEPHMITQFRHPEHPEILTLSNVKVDGKPIGLADGGSHWHTDYAFLQVPAKATMLHSIQVPEVGGNTLFANMYMAYEGLSSTLKRDIEGMRVVHRYGTRPTKDVDARTLAAIRSTPAENAGMVAVHPLVCRHPVTGRRTLYAPVGTAFEIEGLPENESAEVLELIRQHVTRPEYQYSQYYREGDLVIWDNPSLIHAATLTDPAYPRTLLRITVMMDGQPTLS